MKYPISPVTRVGIVHLFATGKGTADNELVQISVTAFSAENNPEEQTWIFNPQRHITKRLRQKTGLTNPQCRSSPSWSKVKEDVWGFLDKVEILFYLDTESRLQWLENVVLAGKADPPALVDLAAMAHFFLPGKERAYTDTVVVELAAKPRQQKQTRSEQILAGMSVLLRSVLNLAHRGQTNGTAGIPPLIYFFVYFVFGSSVPKESAGPAFFRFIQVALGAHKVRWTADQLSLDFALPDKLPQKPGLAVHDVTLFSHSDFRIPLQTEADDDTGCETPRRIDPNYVQDMLNKVLDEKLKEERKAKPRQSDGSSGWSHRKSQQEYVRQCSQAIANGGTYVLEAGTGTGKTLGYLLPACQFAISNPEFQVFIASSTKNLAEQLSKHEWPKMPKEIRKQLTTAILLGKNNYLCRYAVKSFVVGQEFGELSMDERLAWVYMCMVLHNNQGIVEGIPRQIAGLIPAVDRLRRELNAEAACSYESCKHHATCTYKTSLRNARQASIVFTNHHKVALQLSVQDLPRVAVLVVDEADQFAENVRTALKQSVSRRELDDFTWIMNGSWDRGGFVDVLQRKIQKSDATRTAIDSINQVRGDCLNIRGSVARIGELYARNANQGELRWHEMKRPDLQGLYDILISIGELFDRVGAQLKFIRESDRYRDVNVPNRRVTKELEKEYRRLSRYQEKAEDWGSLFKQLVYNHQEKREDYIHTFTSDHSRRTVRSEPGQRWALTQYSFEIGESITGILKNRYATIFTSATLYVDESLDLFELDLLGKNAEAVVLQRPQPIPSEFDHARRVLGGVVDTFGETYNYRWSRDKKRSWDQATACTTAALCVAMYGRTLVLFTSTKDMNQYFAWLEPVLTRYDVELLVQDGPSYEESELFRTSEHSVLFGVNRFWTGVDFPGATCSQVIVVRTPNLSWADPLVKHRRGIFDDETYWSGYYWPKVRLRLIQQFGRLMRKGSDRGLFMVLDPRVEKHTHIFPTRMHRYEGWRIAVDRGLAHMGFTPELKARNINLGEMWHSISESVYDPDIPMQPADFTARGSQLRAGPARTQSR